MSLFRRLPRCSPRLALLALLRRPRPRPRCGSASRRRAHSSSCRSTSASRSASSRSMGSTCESSDFGGGPRVQQALTAGALDIAIGSGPELAMIAKGAPEIGVAAIADAPYAVVLAVLNDGPRTIADLKGKKISVSTNGGLTVLARAGALAPAGLGHGRLRPSPRSAPRRRRPPRSRPSRSTA